MNHKPGLVRLRRSYQDADALRLPCFLIISVLLFMFENICASPYCFWGGVIYFQFPKTDQHLKVVIKA